MSIKSRARTCSLQARGRGYSPPAGAGREIPPRAGAPAEPFQVATSAASWVLAGCSNRAAAELPVGRGTEIRARSNPPARTLSVSMMFAFAQLSSNSQRRPNPLQKALPVPAAAAAG